MKLFFAVAITFFTAVFLFLGYRLTGLGALSWWIAGTPYLFILVYMLLLRERFSHRWEQIFRSTLYFFMGIVSFILGLLIFREILYFVGTITGSPYSKTLVSKNASLLILFLAALLYLYGFWNASRGPRIVHKKIPIQNLPPELEGYSIIHLSDLHVGPEVRSEFVEKIVQQTLSLKADIVVMTGDMVDGSIQQYKNATKSFSKLTQKWQVLYVTGNHEYYKDGELWIEHFTSMGLQPLLNQHTVIEKHDKKILFAGIVDPAVKMISPQMQPSLTQALKSAPGGHVKILLAHQPKAAIKAVSHFDLQLSGHTHGGQFFPWIYVIRLFQKFPKGLIKYGSLWVYVNVGTGYWGPRLRVGTRSEIALLTLTQETLKK